MSWISYIFLVIFADHDFRYSPVRHPNFELSRMRHLLTDSLQALFAGYSSTPKHAVEVCTAFYPEVG